MKVLTLSMTLNWFYFLTFGYFCVLTNTSKDKLKCVYIYFYDKPNVCNVFFIGNKKFLKWKDDWSTSSYASQTAGQTAVLWAGQVFTLPHLLWHRTLVFGSLWLVVFWLMSSLKLLHSYFDIYITIKVPQNLWLCSAVTGS